MVDLDQATYDRLRFAASLLDVTIPELISQLTSGAFEGRQGLPSQRSAPQTSQSAEEVAVHAIYMRTRVEGVFNTANHELRITSGALAGRTFSSPSNAAIAVVESLNPAREHPSTNGRTFWIVTETGQTLRSILGKR